MKDNGFIPNSILYRLYRIAGVAVLLQLLTFTFMAVVVMHVGEKPDTAGEYFAIYETSTLKALLSGHILIMILIGLYLGSIPGLTAVLWRRKPVLIGFAAVFSMITVLGAFFSESSFSLLYLGVRCMEASTGPEHARLAAAAEAVISLDLWNSTAGFLGGIFLQGSGIVISIVMIRSSDFNKITAVSGLMGNALDILQHILHLFNPVIAVFIQAVMGVFYLVWFPILARDFFRLARSEKRYRRWREGTDICCCRRESAWLT